MKKYSLIAVGLLTLCQPLAAETITESVIAADEPLVSQEQLATCLRTSITTAADEMSVRQLKEACVLILQKNLVAQATEPTVIESTQVSAKVEAPAYQERMAIEALNRSNRFMLTPHKRNFILPAVYKDNPNTEPYVEANNQLQTLKHTEAEFQLSVKILLREGIFDDNGHLYLGYTNHSLWQVYNREISAPFRETNHQPELILTFHNDWEIFGFTNVANEFILNHQSNGQSGILSRSWNRIMFNTAFAKDNLIFTLTPWYRLPEKSARYPGDPKGDDNPDINKYMGNFEFNSGYKYGSNIFNLMLRNNLRSENKGAVELGWSFPVSKRSQTIRGYAKYFNGYGHSLIDYDDYTQAIGIGVLFTDIF